MDTRRALHSGGVLTGALLVVLACLALTACGSSSGRTTHDKPFTLPVGPSTWDATAPAWFHAGVLHVGNRRVTLGKRVDHFVLGPTGAYWIRGGVLMFTSARGETRTVAHVDWDNMAVSADHSVFATVDQSRGPTDRYGTHVIQVAVFNTHTGAQIYRTPDAEPEKGADLADLYGELMPMLHGVSDKRVFFDDATIDLSDGSRHPAKEDADGVDVYTGYATTLFPDGYHVGIKGQGRHRTVSKSSLSGVGRLSPNRSTIFDVTSWPTRAVVYDAATGQQHAIRAPWNHFTLAGWSARDTFFGVAERIDEHTDDGPRASQVVTCNVRTLSCTPVSPVIRANDAVLMETTSDPM